MKKQILSIAIMLTLPLTAMADYTYKNVTSPAKVQKNGTITQAPVLDQYVGGYQTISIENSDKEHIASTAYVKGAYNDTIAAINGMNSIKQATLVLSDIGEPADTYVIQAPQFMEVFDANNDLVDKELMTANAIINTIDYKLNNKHVEIYTTWEDDTKTNEVAFIDASQQ